MNTRWIAARVITRVAQDGQSLTAALIDALKTVDSVQDKAFIQALCYGVCRYYHRLDFITTLLLEKPLKVQEVKVLLLIGLYQLTYMRVKPHAAVSETVQAARSLPWARALINAVLRNYLRKQEKLEQQADLEKTAALSHPEWLVRQLEQDWPENAESLFQANNQQPPLALRVNVAKTTVDDYLVLLEERSLLAKKVNFCSSAIVMDKPVNIEILPNFADGWVSIQDTAAQLAAQLLDVQPGDRVLDVCAAPGGKTAHILEQQPRVKELLAIEIDEHRMLRVRENLDRLNLQANLMVADAGKPEVWWDGITFDRILLDAPCSATGVIRRHPDIKLLRKPSDIVTLTQLQKTILNAIWPLLKSGGLLLYATCSVLHQENEVQIGEFLATHDDAMELPIITDSWGIAGRHGRQILTGESSMDGFYYACIVKQ